MERFSSTRQVSDGIRGILLPPRPRALLRVGPTVETKSTARPGRNILGGAGTAVGGRERLWRCCRGIRSAVVAPASLRSQHAPHSHSSPRGASSRTHPGTLTRGRVSLLLPSVEGRSGSLTSCDRALQSGSSRIKRGKLDYNSAWPGGPVRVRCEGAHRMSGTVSVTTHWVLR